MALAEYLGPRRAVEVRIAAADVHRPYDVARSSNGPVGREDIPLAALAALEQRGDWPALFAAQLLRGELEAAEQALAREPAGPQREVDAAALAIAQRRPEVALGHTAAALAMAPRLGAALWNDALARRQMRLPLTAAARFDEVAALGEPGWADEARATAKQLRDAFEEYRGAFRKARDQAAALAASGAPDGVDLALARRIPDPAMAGLHEALRRSIGPDAARLAPLAEALDAAVPGARLAEAVRRIAGGDAAARRPLVAAYTRLAGQQPAPAADAWAALARRATAAAPDIALGALARAVELDAAYAGALAALVPHDDAWLAAWTDDAIGRSLVYVARQVAAAERHLQRAVVACPADRLPARCARLDGSLAVVLAERGRRDLALQHLERALAGARRAQDWGYEAMLLFIAGEISIARDPDTVDRVAVAKAYFDERVAQSPDCPTELARLDYLATAALDVNRIEQARAWSDEADALARGRCREVGTRLNGAAARARVLQSTGATDAEAVARLRAELAAVRATGRFSEGGPAGALAPVLDHIEGRVLLERDWPAGEALLRRAAAVSPTGDNASAIHARDLSFVVLALDAARRGDHAAALGALAGQLGLPPPARCAVGVTGERQVAVAVAGADGAVAGAYRPVPAGRAVVPAEEAVSPVLAKRLAGCETVDVYAPGLYYGQARLLPRELAWRYRSPLAREPAPEPAPAAPAGGRLVVTDVEPPPALALPALHDEPEVAGATVLRGAAATPRRVLGEMTAASEIELHAHGLVDVAEPSAASLLLSPDADGDYALDAERVRKARLSGRPLVLLAACHAARVPASDRPWGLADAFLAAGARSVVASTDELPDAGLSRALAAIGTAVRGGTPAARAVRDLRLARPDHRWLDAIVVFE